MVPNVQLLEAIGQRSMAELVTCPVQELVQAVQEVAAMKAMARDFEVALHGVLNQRFRERAQQLRQEAGKTTGTVRFEDDGFTVIADLPKRVEYDQPKLKEAVEALRKWGENPDDYVGLEITVSETKYGAWPPAVRKLFEPARTLRTGKPSYKLERIDIDALPSVANDSTYGEAS